MGGEHRDPGMAMLGVVTQGKNERQKTIVAAMSSNRPGKPGWYFRVLNCASQKGLSSLTRGRLSERVTPRSARSCAVHLLVMGAPRTWRLRQFENPKVSWLHSVTVWLLVRSGPNN